MLDTIASEAERMERLIKNLLDMTWLEAGGLKLNQQWQPLQEVVGAALHRMHRRLADRAITTDVPGDLPLVHIDAVLIEQLLINLLDNAMQYTPAGTAIEIAARQNGAAIEVEVADRGPGIPAGTEERVFQKFFAPVKRRISAAWGWAWRFAAASFRRIGGAIHAANRPGGGASFRFTIPIAAGAPAIDAAREAIDASVNA